MKIKVKAIVLAVSIFVPLGGLLWSTVAAQSERSDRMPAAVLESVRKAFPRGTIRRVKAHPEIIRIYHVDLTENGQRVRAEVVLNGEILTIHRQISAADAPRALFKSLKKAMAGGELERLVKQEKHATISISSFGRPQVQYRAVVEKGERLTRLTFNSNGRLIDRALSEEEGERELSLDQIPAPARETILRHAGGHRVREVEMHTRGDRRFYEAEWMENGREVEITVDSEGRVLRGFEEEKEEEEEQYDD